MKEQKNKRTVRHKLFISFLLVMIIPIVVFTIFISGYFLINESTNNRQVLKNKAVAISEKIDDELQQIDEYVIGLSVTTWMEKMMYSQGELLDYSRYDPIAIRDYNQQLYISAMLNPFILNMDLILNEKNIVFSEGRNLSKLNTYLEANFDLTESQYTELRKIIGEFSKGVIVYPVKRSRIKNVCMLYIKTIPGKGDSIVRGTVLCIIDMQYLEKTIDQILDNSQMHVLVTYNNELILGDSNLWYGVSRQSIELEDNVYNNSNKIMIDSKKYTILKNSSQRTIENYILIDNKNLVSQLIYIILGSIFLLFLFIVGAYIFARFITKKNYQPLRQLVNMINHPDDFEDVIDELGFEYNNIYKSYKDVISLSKKQYQTINQQQTDMLEYCWKVLLERHHDVDENVLDKIDEVIPIKYYNSHLCAVLIHGNHNKVAKDLAEIINAKENSFCHIVSYSDYTCLVINMINDDCKEKIILCINEFMHKCVISDTICGVGYGYKNIVDINKAYNEAILIVNFNQTNNNRIYFRRDYEQILSNFYYTIAQETQLCNLLRNGDYDGAINIVAEILNVNMSIHSISPRAICNFFFAIYLTGIRVSGEMEYNVKQHVEPSEILHLHNIDEISTVVYSYFKDLCNLVQSETSHHNNLTYKVQLFIKDNIVNPMLSMQMVSEYINRSISYTSRLFNKAYNMPFIQYVNRRRVDIAAEMLKNSNLTIKEVSEQVGFNSEITFRRSFNRFKGVTPSKYRNMT